jgi:hypothetical protein
MISHNPEHQSLAGTEAIRRLGYDIVGFLTDWVEERLSPEFCEDIERLAKLIDRFSDSTKPMRYKYPWTSAIYVYFKRLAADPRIIGCVSDNDWTLYPREKPYSDEFITDFSIYEKGYGFRIACESQNYEKGKNAKRIADGFAKLLHVKSDLKVLIFESDHDDSNPETTALFEGLQSDYLSGYMHFSSHEDYLFLQWSGSKVKCYLWQPFVSVSLVPMKVNPE